MASKPSLPVYDQTDHGIRILEEERRRIARDLHDGPAQTLTNVSMKLNVLEFMMTSNPEMALTQVRDLSKRVSAVINDIRHLIYDLRPIAIDEVGLTEAVKEYCRQCEHNWNIPFNTYISQSISRNDIAPAKQVALYRLVQEIINNMMKHAQATEIKIFMEKSNDQLVITVEDNGVGFDPSYIPPGHYGLIGLRERANYLGGTIDIESTLGTGSRFTVYSPIIKEDNG